MQCFRRHSADATVAAAAGRWHRLDAPIPPSLHLSQVLHVAGARPRRTLDAKSDVWALGCVLHQMCALSVPFRARPVCVRETAIAC